MSALDIKKLNDANDNLLAAMQHVAVGVSLLNQMEDIPKSLISELWGTIDSLDNATNILPQKTSLRPKKGINRNEKNHH